VGDKPGVSGKVKAKILRKLANVSRNTVEQSVTRQQKFNEAVYRLLKLLVNNVQK
jgi:hypothetical protein